MASWLSALGWLIRREYFPAAGEPRPEAVAAFPPSAAFYAVWGRDRQIGIVSTTADTLEDGIRITARQDVDLPMGDGTRRAIFSTNGLYTPSLRLRSFSSRLSGESGGYVIDGRVEGDTLLTLAVSTGSGDAVADEYRLPLAGPVVLPEAVTLWFALQGPMAAGRSERTDVFDPVSLTLSRQELRIVAESILVVPDSAEVDQVSGLWVPASLDTLEAWRVETRSRGLPTSAWIDRGGYLITTKTPLGVRTERSAFEIVRGNYRSRRAAGSSPDATAPLWTSPDADAVKRPAVTALAFALGAAAPGGDEWPTFSLDAPGQRHIGNTVLVQGASLPPRALPYRLPITDSTVWRDLATHVLAPADDPRVQAQARRALRRTDDPREAVTRLVQWTGRNLRLEGGGASPVPQGAAETLERGAGDASDIVLTFVALARAAGIPARPVAGILHVDGRSYYHAWAEVWLDRWIPVDPVYGQAPADTRRLRLLVDGVGRPLVLVPLVTRLRPEVRPEEMSP